MALIVKSRRRAASSTDSVGSPTTSKPLCPRPTFDSRRGSETSSSGDLEDREALADGVHRAEPRQQRLQRGRLEAIDLEIDVLGVAPEQPIANPAADDQRPPAGLAHRARELERRAAERIDHDCGVSRFSPEPPDDAIGQAWSEGVENRKQARRRVGIDLGLRALHRADDGVGDALGRLPRPMARDLEALLARHRVAELGLGADREDTLTRTLVPSSSARSASARPTWANLVAE